MKSSVISNLVMLTGAALAFTGCNEKPKAKAPTLEELAAQKKAYGTCIYNIVKDDLQKVHTQPARTDGLANVTDIIVDGKTVATLTLNAQGTSATYNADAKPVAPLTREQLDAAKTKAPGCYKDALEAG